ncbi:protein phosphatase 1 regulatory subunit 42 [Aplysia californica]|uniref:Protein phosphatase 1 regulatory subunit 42 n=1 Tax=Aplysia californica TaxID=6500 RepID=A0ABM0ZZW1_APLCA|nr:protein phosphatase 1 regulatory subunit 42 [Aplysia californica]
MVKLTMDLIARGTSGYTKKKRDENMQHYVRRLTHLYLENKGIDDIGEDLSLCRNLTVLYLYDNVLNKVPLLNQNVSLTHLYLQNNNISRIENLSALTRLQKLYIGGNTITVLEGLEKLQQLQELHVESQRLPPGEQLLFDPRTVKALAACLQVLNVSGNNLTSIRELEQLPGLTQLLATDNQLSDMKELAHLLTAWHRLGRLDLAGNPVCLRAKYKDRIIVMGKHLEILDGKSITDTTRQFLMNWQASREIHRKKGQDELSRQDTFSAVSTNGLRDLPPVRSASTRQTGVSGYVMPGLPRKQFDDILAKSSFPDNDPTRKTRSGILRANYVDGAMVRMDVPGSAPPSQLRRPLSVESLRMRLNRSAHLPRKM